MLVRLRLLPVLILVAALTLMVKVSHLWQTALPFIQAGPSAALAQETGAGGPAAEDGPGFTPWRVEPASLDAGEAAPDTSPTASLRDPYEMTDEEIELLQQLSARREEIDRLYRELEQREALLGATEQRVTEKIAELEALRKSIESLVVQHDEQGESRLRSLVKIYESMKPKEAARIFEDLDLIVLLEVIDRMKERKTAPILARMTPGRARNITLELARRRDLPVTR